MGETASVITGGQFSDERGQLTFLNEFDMAEIKRTYFIENSMSEPLRAWQAHKVEKKWFMVLKGAFEVFAIKMNDWDKPTHGTEIQKFELSADKPQVLCLPGNHANGILTLEENSVIQVYSDLSFDEAKNDQYKFPKGMWSVD